MSSQTPGDEVGAVDAEDPNAIKHPQKFVQVRFEPGEWDPERRDPLFKPPFKSRAKIISAEDFAERPRVGFEEEFDSLRDAMITLTWLDGATASKIYDAYLAFMNAATGPTSHEYVMRMLGQKYNITAQRVAGIVELAHREEQLRKSGKKVYDDAQDYVDSKIREHIDRAYAEYREPDPEEFVEDPMGVTGIPNREYLTGSTISVQDVVDVDGLMKATLIREELEARLNIDGHIYREDVDEETLFIKVNKETLKMMEAKRVFQGSHDPSQISDDFKPMPGNEQPRRSRWKYAALTINTRDVKKNRKHRISLRRKQTQIIDNVIVEHDGEIRVASIAEIRKTSWKPVRDIKEHTFSGVKAAWLERTLRGEKGGWGRQKSPDKTEQVAISSAAEDGAEVSMDGEEDVVSLEFASVGEETTSDDNVTHREVEDISSTAYEGSEVSVDDKGAGEGLDLASVEEETASEDNVAQDEGEGISSTAVDTAKVSVDGEGDGVSLDVASAEEETASEDNVTQDEGEGISSTAVEGVEVSVDGDGDGASLGVASVDEEIAPDDSITQGEGEDKNKKE